MIRITKSNEAPPFPGGGYRHYIAGNVYCLTSDPPGTEALARRAVAEGWGVYDPPRPELEPLPALVAEALKLDDEPPLGDEAPAEESEAGPEPSLDDEPADPEDEPFEMQPEAGPPPAASVFSLAKPKPPSVRDLAKAMSKPAAKKAKPARKSR